MKLLKHIENCIIGKFHLLIGGWFLSAFVFSGSLFGQKQLVFRIDHIQKVSKKELPFTDSLSLQRQIADVQFQAYKKGYLTFSVDSLVKADSITTFAYGSLGEQFQSLNLTISPANRKLLRSIGFSPKTLESNKPDPQSIANTLESILKKLENSGYPFAKVGFKTLAQSEGKLYTELVIDPSFRLKWNKLEITGNNIKISPKFIAAYLHLEEGAWYEQDVVELIPVRMKQLTYLRETKPAELLFTPEGVTLYLYLESKPVSSFNGTVGLQQNPVTLNYQFTGDLRLRLQNAFKRGELMEFNWRSVSPGSPQLKTQVTLPFLLNTPFGLDGQFQLVKSDSTYLELKSSAGVSYFLSAGNTLKGFYRNYSSSVLGSNSSSLIGNVKNNQYGLSLSHQTIDYLPNPRKGFIWYIEGSAGKRKLTKDTITQNALVFTTKIQLDWYTSFGKKFVLKLGVNAESYTSDNIQQNELLRFGGNLNQRGFLEDELLASTKSTATVETRFILDQNSYLFAFYDQSWYERNASTGYVHDTPHGFGAGLSFGTSVGIFSITYALGKQFNNPILLRDSKIHFGYVAYF